MRAKVGAKGLEKGKEGKGRREGGGHGKEGKGRREGLGEAE